MSILLNAKLFFDPQMRDHESKPAALRMERNFNCDMQSSRINITNIL